MGKIEKACKISYYVRLWTFGGCWESREHGRCIYQNW